jgi:RNA polymerase sigma-70 factor (ECF subfamily)
MDRSPATKNPAEFEKIVRAHQAMVFSLAWHFLGNRESAEELAQDVFLQLYDQLECIRSPMHLRFWLRRVTVHRCVDYGRRAARRRTLSLDEAPEVVAAPARSDPLLAQTLDRLVRSLPAKARMVVILRFQEDMELQDIADAMEMPLNTVKSSLQRALLILRAKMGRLTEGVRV